MVGVLVVDRKGTCKAAKEVLAPLGHQVIPVISNSLALFLAHKNLPELILSDIETADGTGFEFLQALKADPELNSIPFVFVSGKENEGMKSKALALGASKFLTQPTADELFNEIKPYLNPRQNQRLAETPE